MKKYYATDGGIVAKEILRETEGSVWIASAWEGSSERRESKKTTYGAYFDTFNEAFYWALSRAENNVSNAKLRVAYAEAHLQKVKGWTEDKTADEAKR